MDLEDDTPQVEDRSMLEALEVLGIESQETTPSSEDVSMPSAIPGVGRRQGGEEDMSQSYHEIFETQAYMQSRKREEEEREERRWKNEDVKAPKIEKPKETISKGPGGTDIISPGSDLVGSENSGSTETGIQVVPQGDVYLRDGRLVCDEDTENARDYLTSKLVADSLMWQQTFRNDSPSPEECLVQETIKPTKVINPTTDAALIEDVERQARRLATDVDNVVENLSCILQSISALTVETVETYRDGVCKTCDAVDDNIKGMYQLMAKWEELNKSMGPAYKLHAQIKDIKKLLDVYEAALSSS